MRQPIVAQLEKDVIQYWAKVKRDPKTGHLPHWAFDFISIHSRGSKQGVEYSMTSPLCLVDQTGRRPEFELDSFKDKAGAIKQARTLAREFSPKVGRKIFIVDCR